MADENKKSENEKNQSKTNSKDDNQEIKVEIEKTKPDVEKQVQFNREDIKHKVLTSKAKMNLKPHKGDVTKDYLMMLHEADELKDKPEWDRSQNSLTLSMIESRKNLNTAQRLLDEKREEFSRYCKLRDKQIKDLTEKEKKLRESFEFFDEFVKENIEKRERSEERIIKEKEMCKEITEDIKKVNDRLVRLNELKDDMINAIEDYSKFEDYLINVGKALPHEFSSKPEKIIERYELLVGVRDELGRLQRQQIESLQEISTEIDEETDRRSEQLIDLNNLLSDLCNRREYAGQEAWIWKCVLNKVEETAAVLSLETEQAQSACDELYLQVCRDIGKPIETPDPNKVGEQLRVILDRILELRRIVKKARERESCNYSNRPNSLLSRPKREKPKPRTRP